MKCIYCKHPYTYVLKDGQHKCSSCRRKFSPKKIAREEKLFEIFLQGRHARDAAISTGMHFATVQKYYDTFRHRLARNTDEEYHKHRNKIDSHDEYLYLPKSLAREKNIHKLQRFLTFSYGDKVYNLMVQDIQMPALEKSSEQRKRLLKKYLRFSKVAKLHAQHNTITEFWAFFEAFMIKYRGVSSRQFVFYLKEAEWRFNNKYIVNTDTTVNFASF